MQQHAEPAPSLIWSDSEATAFEKELMSLEPEMQQQLVEAYTDSNNGYSE